MSHEHYSRQAHKVHRKEEKSKAEKPGTLQKSYISGNFLKPAAGRSKMATKGSAEKSMALMDYSILKVVFESVTYQLKRPF
jgi:hypothetical protein